MAHVIPKGTTNNDQRTLDFFVGTAADPLAAMTSGVAGVAPRLRFGDNAVETGDNTIVAISAADGWYRYTLSDTEANNAVCLASLFMDATDVAGIAPVREPFQIGPATINNDGVDVASIDGHGVNWDGTSWAPV